MFKALDRIGTGELTALLINNSDSDFDCFQLPTTIGQDVSDVEDATDKQQWQRRKANKQGGQKSQSHQQQPQQVDRGLTTKNQFSKFIK